jgi:YopX protein
MMPMQFTGLHDVNGKDIYEGDIIGMSPKWKYEVVWSDEKARWALRSTFAVPHANGKRAAKVFQALTNATTRPVIGNIYENPDLLSV